jgi:3-oxoisoapionate kinase
VLSGSCSPVTQAQIEHAARNGFELVRLDVRGLASGATASAANAATRSALDALSAGRSVVLYTAAAPDDRVEDFASAAGEREFRHTLSKQGGQILNRIVDESGVRRIVVAGGDTSSHAGRQLGIDALTFRAHVAPGAPLCAAWSERPTRQGLEVVFKGGQCGKPQFFETVLNGSDNGRN